MQNISGTYFAQAREYMPEVGRFAGRDIVKGTILDSLTLNNYHYCYSNPSRYVDLDGMTPEEATLNEIDKISKSVEIIGWSVGETGAGSIAQNLANPGLYNWVDSAKSKTKITMRDLKRDVRINKNRASKISRPGRAKNAAEKLAESNRLLEKQTARSVKLGKASDFLSKNGKYVGGAASVGAEVGVGLIEDTYNGVSVSKKKSNALVNAGFALGGVLAEGGIAYALTAVGVSAGPAGWIALGVVFAVSLTLSLTGVDDVVKNHFNSLD